MAAPGRLSLSGAPCSERFEDRDEAFRKLLCDVSQYLHEDDVQQMTFLTALPERPKNKLDLLTELHRRGRFSPRRTEPLSRLLKDVNRYDLAEKLVDHYRADYPDVEDEPVTHALQGRSRRSLPPSASPRVVQKVRRSNTETDASPHSPPRIVVDHVSEKDWARPSLTREANVEQEVGSQHATQQVNPSLLRPPSSNLDRETSWHHTAPFRGRSHSFDSSDATSLSSLSDHFELASSLPHATSPSSPSSPTFPVLDFRSSPQVPGRKGRCDRSTASSPDHSHHHHCLGDEGNGSDAEHHHSLQSSPASSIHIHLHLPQSHSSEALLSAASSGGGGAGSPRARLHSAPEQVLQHTRPHRRVSVSFSVPSHMHGYQQSGDLGVNCSSEQLQSSLSASEELVSPGGKPPTMLIDRQQEKRGNEDEDRQRFTSDNTLTPDSPRASSMENCNDSGKLDLEKETKQNSVTQTLGDAHHRPQNLSQRIFQRRSRPKKSDLRTLSWTIHREEASEMIWNHKEQGSVRCPEQLQVDTRCGGKDPHLTFQLYPYGLFEDKGKNMTLFVKTIIPDDCPPIHPSTKLHLTVRVSTVEGKQLHVHQLESKVNSCVLYTSKLMSHKELQKITCKKLCIEVSASTS